MRRYFDYNATTPQDYRVTEAMVHEMGRGFGNPSSVHAEGRLARQALETARGRVAKMVGGQPEEIVFTSGGTEADMLGVIGLARGAAARGAARRVVSTAIEHPAVTGSVAALAAEGFATAICPVQDTGVIDESQFAAQLNIPTAVVAISLANHELGTIQNIRALTDIAHSVGAWVHCDAVQAAGRIPIDVEELGVDSLAVSAHKIYGPKGIGALWVRRSCDIRSLIAAGHQERERRGGTENVVAAVGFGVAAELAVEAGLEDVERCIGLQMHLESGLGEIPQVEINGHGVPRVANTTNVRFCGALGSAVVAAMDIAGFALSTGAACTSGSVEASPVLLGIGRTESRAVEAVRISLGRPTLREDVDALLLTLPEVVARARKFR